MSSLLARLTGRDADPAEMGHNNPPSDMEILQERINENNAKLLGSVDQLLADAAALPKVIENDDQAGEVTDKIKELTGTMKALESTRVAEKEPYLALTRAVDGFFKVPAGKLELAKKQITVPLNDYLNRKATAERIRRENEARALREAAEAQAAEAAALERANPAAAKMEMASAIVTEQHAQHVQQSVSAKPAELANSRGTSGGLASIRTRIVGEVVDRQILDLNALRPYFTEDALQKALNAAVSAGVRTLTGARIYEKTDTVVR